MIKCRKIKVLVKGWGELSGCRGDNLGKLLASNGILPLPCGGRGLCGLCRVKILAGETNELTIYEKIHGIKKPWRLACRVTVHDDLVVEIPKISEIEYVMYTLNIPIKNPDPLIRETHSYKEIQKETYLYKEEHPNPLHTLLFNKKVVMTSPVKVEKILLVDLGTTKIAYQVIDLDGNILVENLLINPLVRYGSDIITRMSYILDYPSKLVEMMNELHKSIEKLAKENNVCYILLAGNSVMEHLYLGLSIESLAMKPYRPVLYGPFLTYTGPYPTLVAPIIEGFVGGDAYSELIATLYMDLPKPYLIIDLGTNTEVMLVTRDKIYVTSTPAGPAFEGFISRGSHIAFGGITRVWIKEIVDEKPVFGYSYIGSPHGLLGAGVLSLVASLYAKGFIDKSGRFVKGYANTDSGKAFIIDQKNNVLFTQRDLREFQKAYAAVKSAWRILLDKAGISREDLKYVIISGSFGSALSPKDLIVLGIVPLKDEEKIVISGNLVLLGLKIMTMKRDYYSKYNEIRGKLYHINLADEPNYMDVWVKELYFSS